MWRVLITGSCGLIGSEDAFFFSRHDYQVSRIDNNHRGIFFGPEGDTSWVLGRLQREAQGYSHQNLRTTFEEIAVSHQERVAQKAV